MLRALEECVIDEGLPCQYDEGLPPDVEEDAHEWKLDNAPGGKDHAAEG